MATTALAPMIGSRPAVAVGGQDRPALTGGLLELRICEHVHGMYTCEATFGNWNAVNGATGFLHFGRDVLEFGKDIAISFLGKTAFSGRVMALEAGFDDMSPPTLTVLAEDRFQDLRMTRRTRAWEDVADADVIREIASAHGLTPDVAVDGPRHKVVAQVNQSDLAFLRDRARAIDAELWLDGKTLHAASHTGRGGAPVKLALGSGVRSFVVVADLAGQRTRLDVCGWDVAAKGALRETATDDVLGSELAGGQSGAAVLRAALGERKEAVVHRVPLTSGEARATAESLYRQRLRRFVCGHGVAEPDPTLHAGSRIRISGLGPLFSGEHYVTEVRHLFDAAGLRTEFATERAGLGGQA